MFYKIEVKASRNGFPDKFTEYVAAYSYDQAIRAIEHRLNEAGWKLDGHLGHQIKINDLRDSCDHTTDC